MFTIEMKVRCSKCDREIPGSITFDDRNTIMDTTGFMIFRDPGVVCDACLKEEG